MTSTADSSCLFVRVKAPFAAYRGLHAGHFFDTFPTMPPSAAFGLLLNLAGIEMRGEMRPTVTTIRKDLPAMQIAVGDIPPPKGLPLFAQNERMSNALFQHLHVYPVGDSNDSARKEGRTCGQKGLARPARRRILVGLDCLIAVRAEAWLIGRILSGCQGEFNSSRYGIPFAGDNNFFFELIEPVLSPFPPQSGEKEKSREALAHWYSLFDSVSPDERLRRLSPQICSLTIGIDREVTCRSSLGTFAMELSPSPFPPPEAWVWVPPPPHSVAAKAAGSANRGEH